MANTKGVLPLNLHVDFPSIEWIAEVEIVGCNVYFKTSSIRIVCADNKRWDKQLSIVYNSIHSKIETIHHTVSFEVYSMEEQLYSE